MAIPTTWHGELEYALSPLAPVINIQKVKKKEKEMFMPLWENFFAHLFLVHLTTLPVAQTIYDYIRSIKCKAY